MINVKRSKYIIIIVATCIYECFFCVLINKSTEKYKLINDIAYQVCASNDENTKLATDILKGSFDSQEISNGHKILDKYGYGEEFNSYFDDLRKKEEIQIAGIGVILYVMMLICIYLYIYLEKCKYNKVLSIAKEQLSGISEGHYEEIEEVKDKAFTDNEEGKLYDVMDTLSEKLKINKEKTLQEKENTKTLVTDISHQLKTPIASIKMCYSLLNDDSLNQDEKNEFSARMEEQIEHLENLSDALINVSRLETGMINVHVEDKPIFDTLIAAVNAVYLKAEAAGISIEMDEVDKDLENIIIPHDTKWTKEAIVNILDNGIKYSEKNTTIHITMQKLTNYLRIEIEDEGIGIDKSEFNNIFKRFYRGKSEKVKQKEGSGVGLYLTRQILEAQKGQVLVLNKAGKKMGVTFVINLSL